MKRCRGQAQWFLWLTLVFSACGVDQGEKGPLLIFSQTYDFSESDHGWTPGFADFPASREDSALFALRYAYTDQPAGSILTKRSMMLSGNNVNSDLFMYLKKKVTGLRPHTDYTLTFKVDLASTCHSTAAAGAGSVYLKAGASEAEPLSVVQGGYYVMNLDKGNGGTTGEQVISLGELGSTEHNAGYVLLSRNNTMANSRYVARTDAHGELWLIIGTDSTLEGETSIFYTRVNVVFSAS